MAKLLHVVQPAGDGLSFVVGDAVGETLQDTACDRQITQSLAGKQPFDLQPAPNPTRPTRAARSGGNTPSRIHANRF
jgi:hypothetical protein